MSSINPSFSSSFPNTQLEPVNSANSKEKPVVSTQTPALNSTSLIGKQVLSSSQQVEAKIETTNFGMENLSSEKSIGHLQLKEKEKNTSQIKPREVLSKTASNPQKVIKYKASTVNFNSFLISLSLLQGVKDAIIDENEPEGLRGEEWLKIVTDLKHYTGPRAQDLRKNLSNCYFFFTTIEELMTAFKESLLNQKTPLDAMPYFELMKTFILDPNLHEEELKKPEVADCLLAIHQHFKNPVKKDEESFRVLDRGASQLLMDFYCRSNSKDPKLVNALEEWRKSGDLSSNIHLSAQAKLWAASKGLSKRIAPSAEGLELSYLTTKSEEKQDVLNENFFDAPYLKELFADHHSRKVIDLTLCFLDSQETAVVLTAQDIVFIHRQLLQQLTSLELSGVCQDILQKKVGPNIGDFHRRLAFWVRETLLVPFDIEERLKRIDFFWKLRDQLLDLKDYGSCHAIHGALKLSQTVAMGMYVKEELSRKETNEFYDQLFDFSRSFANLKKIMEADKAAVEKYQEDIKQFKKAIPNQKLELKNQMEKEENQLLEKLEESNYLPLSFFVLMRLKGEIENGLLLRKVMAKEGQVSKVVYENMQIYQKFFNELKIPASLPSSFKELNTNLALLLCPIRTDEDRDCELYEKAEKINLKDLSRT